MATTVHGALSASVLGPSETDSSGSASQPLPHHPPFVPMEDRTTLGQPDTSPIFSPQDTLFAALRQQRNCSRRLQAALWVLSIMSVIMLPASLGYFWLSVVSCAAFCSGLSAVKHPSIAGSRALLIALILLAAAWAVTDAIVLVVSLCPFGRQQLHDVCSTNTLSTDECNTFIRRNGYLQAGSVLVHTLVFGVLLVSARRFYLILKTVKRARERVPVYLLMMVGRHHPALNDLSWQHTTPAPVQTAHIDLSEAYPGAPPSPAVGAGADGTRSLLVGNGLFAVPVTAVTDGIVRPAGPDLRIAG